MTSLDLTVSLILFYVGVAEEMDLFVDEATILSFFFAIWMHAYIHVQTSFGSLPSRINRSISEIS